MKAKKALAPPLLLLLVLGLCCFLGEVAGAELPKECYDSMQALMNCLPYSTGKADAPTGDCCQKVGDIRGSKPKCLCSIILQAHAPSNSQQLFSVGLSFSRLLSLPKACNLSGPGIENCPVLLNIPPGDPDNAVFNGTAKVAATNMTMPSSSASSHVQHTGSIIMAMASALISSLL